MSLSSKLWIRGLAATSAAVVVAAAGGAAAFADDVYNTLDASIDAVAETTSVAVDKSTSVTYAVQPRTVAGDENGCNFGGPGAQSLVVSVSSSDIGIATVSPSSLTFTDCGSGPSVTVTGEAAGTATILLTQTSNTTGGVFNLAPATFTVNVTAPSNTPPSVGVTGVTDGATYEYSDVPTAGCSVTDTEDGAKTVAPVLSAITGGAAPGLGSQTATCSYTDAGGLSASASATYTIVDTTEPTVTLVSRTPQANAFGWNNGAVTVVWSCTDDNGVVATTVSDTVSTEGEDQEATGTCEDSSGNTASAAEGDINIDLTDPTVSLVGGPADGGVYYAEFVPAAPTCTAFDGLSGVDGACSVTGWSQAAGTHTVTATATDEAGNTSSVSLTYTALDWSLTGFYQPVDMGVLNTVKSGSTVPLKFEFFVNDVEVTSTEGMSFTATAIPCPGTEAGSDAIEFTTSGSTTLRYDSIAGQFVQNWQTPKGKAGNCYTVTMTVEGGPGISADFKLK